LVLNDSPAMFLALNNVNIMNELIEKGADMTNMDEIFSQILIGNL